MSAGTEWPFRVGRLGLNGHSGSMPVPSQCRPTFEAGPLYDVVGSTREPGSWYAASRLVPNTSAISAQGAARERRTVIAGQKCRCLAVIPPSGERSPLLRYRRIGYRS